MLGHLCNDILGIIISDYDPVDVYNLKHIDKYHYANIPNDMIYEMIKKNVVRKLREIYGDKYDEVTQTMEKYKMRMSGSFLIQCALNNYWNSDIDLYTLQYVNEKIFSWTHAVDVFSNDTERRSPYVQILDIRKITDYVPNHTDSLHKNVLQLITLDANARCKSVSSCIRSTFDFDICRNVYKIKNGEASLKIGNLHGLMNKEIHVGNGMGRNNAERYEKYAQRGFKIRPIATTDYIKYINCVFPIITCNVDDKNKMHCIYFLGKNITDDVWENDNLIISYFDEDMFRIGDGCSCTETPSMSMKKKDEFTVADNCPIKKYCDQRLHDHCHSTISVYQKATKEEYSCDVIVIKRIDATFDYSVKTDADYGWLDVISNRNTSYGLLIDTRQVSKSDFFDD